MIDLVGCCSVLQCGAVWCSVVQCGAVWCSVVQCGAVCCCLDDRVCHIGCGVGDIWMIKLVGCCSVAVWCSVVQCGAVWCSVLLFR